MVITGCDVPAGIFRKEVRSHTGNRMRNILEKEMDNMSYMYKTRGTCSTQIEVELDGNVVKFVKFTGGCNGNLQAIPKLVEGLTIEQVEEKIGGISCNGRPTSCGDQLAKACRAAYEAAQK